MRVGRNVRLSLPPKGGGQSWFILHHVKNTGIMHLTPIAGAVFGNVFLAVCTALALVGGLLILFSNRAVADLNVRPWVSLLRLLRRDRAPV